MYSSALHDHRRQFRSTTEDGKGTRRTDCGGDRQGCRKLESQIRLTFRRQGCCESIVLLHRAWYEVRSRLRHSSARDCVGPRLDISCLAVNALDEMYCCWTEHVPRPQISAMRSIFRQSQTGDIRHLPNLSIGCRVSRQAMQRQDSRGKPYVFSDSLDTDSRLEGTTSGAAAYSHVQVQSFHRA